MSNASAAGLLEFISEQPANRPVYHGSWAQCAAGDYARSIGESIYDSRTTHDYEELRNDPTLLKLWNDAGTEDYTYSEMYRGTPHRSRSIMDVLSENHLPNTYGELYQYIRSRL